MGIPFKIRVLLWKDRFFDKSADEMEAPEARTYSNRYISKVMNKIDHAPISMQQVKDIKIPMRDNQDIQGRIYRPNDSRDIPVIIYYHGGGFVLYDIESHDRVCRRLADTTQSMVISIDYRLAPEYKFPIPAHDAYDSMLWVASKTADLGINADRISVAGDSAGANLATVTCMMSMDLDGPKVHAQILIYPTVDATFQFASIERNGKGYLLTKKRMEWFVNHYAVDENDKSDPYMSPIYREDLVGLPPAFVFTAEYDPLVDEGAAYAQKLKAAGVKTKYKMFDGMIHGFINLPRLTKRAIEAHRDIKIFLDELEP